MKYTKTVDLWNVNNMLALEAGTLKLQGGQWVRCGNARPSRFVTLMNSGSVWAVHPTVVKGRDSKQFAKYMSIVRDRQAKAA